MVVFGKSKNVNTLGALYLAGKVRQAMSISPLHATHAFPHTLALLKATLMLDICFDGRNGQCNYTRGRCSLSSVFCLSAHPMAFIARWLVFAPFI
jgi:hypothetical protein